MCDSPSTPIKKRSIIYEYFTEDKDTWSDSVMRSLNGYVVQFIDSDWISHTIPILFTPFAGTFLIMCILYN
jgi:hypothetical protein